MLLQYLQSFASGPADKKVFPATELLLRATAIALLMAAILLLITGLAYMVIIGVSQR